MRFVHQVPIYGATFKLRNTEGYGSSQTEIIALGGSSKAESETVAEFTLKRTSRS